MQLISLLNNATHKFDQDWPSDLEDIHAELFAAWDIFMLFCHLLIFFKIFFFRKNISGIPSMSNSLDPDQAIMSGLIWVQDVCKSYQQMTLVGKELKVLTDGLMKEGCMDKVKN